MNDKTNRLTNDTRRKFDLFTRGPKLCVLRSSHEVYDIRSILHPEKFLPESDYSTLENKRSRGRNTRDKQAGTYAI